MGENGAGKSTLIKIMTGAVGRDEGEIRIDGQPVAVASPGEARASGVGAVYPEVNLIPTMSVTENLTLGRQPRRFGLVSWRVARAVAREWLERLKIDVEQQLGSYSLAVQQLIAIARALEDDTRVLVLDERTASLDANEVELLFKIVRDLKARDIAIVFITHFLDQVYRIADRISVLRNGRLVGTSTAAELPRLKLISMMLGRELEETEERLEASPHGVKGEPILVAEGLGRRRVMAPFDLSLKAGEVVGLAGLLGSGRTEVAKLVFGAIKPDSGRLEVASAPVGAHSPGQSTRRGMAFCPEDRKAEGIFAELTVRENIVLGLQTRRGWLACLSRAEQDRLAGEMIEALGIATPDAEKPVGQLSGGNQQKVVLARALVSGPSVLILDEPTVVALGMAVVIGTKGIDLSVGSVIAIVGAVITWRIHAGDPHFVILMLAPATGLLCGLWNGFLVAVLDIQPIIATLILTVSGRGIGLMINLLYGGANPSFMSPLLEGLSVGHVGLIPTRLILAAAIFGALWLLLRRTALGLFLESVGGNSVAADLAGINARLIKYSAYLCLRDWRRPGLGGADGRADAAHHHRDLCARRVLQRSWRRDLCALYVVGLSVGGHGRRAHGDRRGGAWRHGADGRRRHGRGHAVWRHDSGSHRHAYQFQRLAQRSMDHDQRRRSPFPVHCHAAIPAVILPDQRRRLKFAQGPWRGFPNN